MMEGPSLTSREVARKASRELIKQQNDTTGGGKVRFDLALFLKVKCLLFSEGSTERTFGDKVYLADVAYSKTR